MSVWVVAEHRSGELRPVTLELLAAARELFAGPVTAVLLAMPGESPKLAGQLKTKCDAILSLAHAELQNGCGGATVPALAELAGERAPTLLIGAHSAAGMEWAPALAAKLDSPLVTDAVSLAFEGGKLYATRMVYGGKLLARVSIGPPGLLMATVRPGTFEPLAVELPEAPVEEVQPQIELPFAKRFLELILEAAATVDIAAAPILVSVGRGLGDRENLDIAEKLAKALGATISCSRPVVDMNWLPKERQVGISGKTVKPGIYIALGISGAFQHVTAMKGAGVVIAVNKDPKAPIFRVADYGIVGDLHKVVPALTAAVVKAQSQG